MTPREIHYWTLVARDLDIKIETPFFLDLPDVGSLAATALIKQFGAERGMVVDAAYSVLRPYTKALVRIGFGYSVVDASSYYDRASCIEMLADWGWTGLSTERPHWLPQQMAVLSNI